MNTNRKFIIVIKAKNKVSQIEVYAINSKEAKKMVEEVLIKCPMFKFSSKNDFKLECIKVNKSEVCKS